MVIEIGKVKIECKSLPELQEAVKAELAAAETRLKEVEMEHKNLRSICRDLKEFLEGKKPHRKKPEPTAP